MRFCFMFAGLIALLLVNLCAANVAVKQLSGHHHSTTVASLIGHLQEGQAAGFPSGPPPAGGRGRPPPPTTTASSG